MSEQNAFVAKKVTTSTVYGSEGTGSYARVPGFETAVKTGTTNDEYDRWLCGFTEKYTAAVWYGFDKAETIHWYRINPAGLIWGEVMRAIHKDLKGEDFKRPDDIEEVAVCRDSGLLPRTILQKGSKRI